MNLFERLMLRRLMDVAGEVEGGAPAASEPAEQQQGQHPRLGLLSPGEPAGQQAGQQPQKQGAAAFIEKLPDDGDEKGCRTFTLNSAARKN